jgi:hypothetical protein
MMSNVDNTNIGAQGRTSRSRRRRISLAIAGVAVILVAGTVVIGTQANGSRSGSLVNSSCDGVDFLITGKGTWSKFDERNTANEAQIDALNNCDKLGNWVINNGEWEVTGWYSSYFWAQGKTICKVSYYSIGSNYKGTYCSPGNGRGDEEKHAIVLD